MAPKPGTVELYVTDRDGVRWRVYGFAILAGETRALPIGTVDGTYRGFQRRDGVPELRAHLVARREETARARVLSAAELQRELDASYPWPPPGGPAMPVPRRAGPTSVTPPASPAP